MSSPFDPKTFETMTFTGANSTESVPIPVGEWPMEIEKKEVTAWAKKDDPSINGLKLTLTLKTEEPKIVEITGRPVNKARFEIMLDLTPEGGLDMGKGMNVQLGRLRAAVGLNRPDVPFAFDMLVGRTVLASIKHEEYQGKLQARVSAVAPVTA